jgi:protein phosphatase
MGTTLVAATVVDHCIYVANVGDSRLYLINEGIHQITRDHSLVEEMVRIGQIDREQARNHPDKNIITRAVGVRERVSIDFFEIKLEEGDLVLMCSDGLTNMIEDQQIREIIETYRKDLPETALELVAKANENGGRDNIAVVLIEPLACEVEEC